MEPRPYLRIVVSGIAIRSSTQLVNADAPKLPEIRNPDVVVVARPAQIAEHPDPQISPYHCEVKLKGFPSQSAPVPFLPANITANPAEPDCLNSAIAASFYLDHPTLKNLLLSSSSPSCLGLSDCPSLDITITSASSPTSSNGHRSFFPWRRKPGMETLGRLSIRIDMDWARPNLVIAESGWFCLNKPAKTLNSHSRLLEVHLKVTVESEPRYVFEFEGQPELSPQIVQIQGSLRQPIFSCTFTRDRVTSRVSSFEGALTTAMGVKITTKGDSKEERKGWMVIIHDLSGSKVAVASMVTPFVPTSGSDRVTRSNPGAWLILRPGGGGEGDSIWIPWGRLEAWREKGEGVAFRLELVSTSLVVAETVINAHKGGEFTIDTTFLKSTPPQTVESPRINSIDVGHSRPGFVMSTQVQGQGKPSKPHVLLATHHVTCVEDAAVFVALAAALDLSMDACLPFSRKLGKTFSQRF